MFIGMNFIDGSFTPNRPDFPSVNPSTEYHLGLFPNSTKQEVEEAVFAARRAFKKWKSLSRVERAEYFDKLASLIKESKEQIANAISQETGKNLNESVAEVNEALHMVQYTFGKGREACGDVIASEIADRDAYVLRKPKGVVAVIAPWNFPFAIGGFWCAAPALLEGNTVVFKPSENTPMTGQIIANLYNKAGFPPGVFNLVHGKDETGEFLTNSDVDHICFTGSAEVGRKIRRVCAESWHKTCSCEMGSKSAVMIFRDADWDLALKACIASAFKLSGQRCVSAGRILVQRDAYDYFCEQFLDLARKVTVGDPFEDPVPTMGPIISKEQLQRIMEFNDKVNQDSDTKVLLSAEVLKRNGYFITPHVYKCEWGDKLYLKNEVFGPHVAIIPFDGPDEAIKIYNDTDFGLSLGVITNDFRIARRIRNECDFGLGYWNMASVGAESHLPFSGIKKSGFGGGSAAGTFDAVVHKIAWSVNHGGLVFPQGMK